MKKHTFVKQVVILIAVLAFFPLSQSALANGKDPAVAWDIGFDPESLRAGEVTVLHIKASIPDGYHFYSMTQLPDGPIRMDVQIEGNSLSSASDWHGPTPHVEFEKNFGNGGAYLEYFEGVVIHNRAFKLSGMPSKDGVALKITGQICSKIQCIKQVFETNAKLQLEPGEARKEQTLVPELEGEIYNKNRKPPGAVGATGPNSNALTKSGFWLFLLAAFGFGFLALATPCVFPMIPITISFFSKFQKVSLKRSFIMATTYMLSIVAVFVVLGSVLTLIFGGGAMQEVSTSTVFNVFMAALLLFFAFNLFGLFEIRMPSWLISSSSQKELALTSSDGSLGHQMAGVFFMAVTFTLVSFTCTVGFLGMVLALGAQGEWFYFLVGMIGFAFGFALPFFFLALFPKLADKLEGRGGDWMVAVKVVLGFVEAAFAFKFLSNIDLTYELGIVTRPAVLAIWGVLATLTGLYLLRVFALTHDDITTKHVGPIRMTIAATMFVFAAHFFLGMGNTKPVGGWIDGWLPPIDYTTDKGTNSFDHSGWITDDIELGFETAKQDNRPLFIDFTGNQCTNCRQMESQYFTKTSVRSHFKKMTLVRAITDGNKEVHENQGRYKLEMFSTQALPFYVIFNPHTKEVLATFASLASSEQVYLDFLDKGIALYEKQRPKTLQRNSSIQLPSSGEPIDFEFPDLKTSKPVKLSSFRGNWVLLNFWASWCNPCKKELTNDFPPALATSPNVKLVTVAFDGEDTKDQATKFADKIDLFKHTTLQGGEDIQDAGLSPLFEITDSLPITYLIHPKGHIAWSVQGSVHKEILIELLAETAIN